MLHKRHAALAENCAVKEVSCVNLYTGQICVNLECSAAYRLANSYICLAFNVLNNKVVVIAAALCKLNVIGINSFADCVRLGKIKSRTLNAAELTCGNTVFVGGCIERCVHLKLMSENI